MWQLDDTSGAVALAIVGLFPAVAVLIAVVAQSKTIAAFAQLGGLREPPPRRLEPSRPQTTPPLTLGCALGRGARGGTGRVRSAAEDARVCHLCGREGDPSLAWPHRCVHCNPARPCCEPHRRAQAIRLTPTRSPKLDPSPNLDRGPKPSPKLSPSLALALALTGHPQAGPALVHARSLQHDGDRVVA